MQHSRRSTKIVSIKTNEPVFDSNPTNLQTQEIVWGDNTSQMLMSNL